MARRRVVPEAHSGPPAERFVEVRNILDREISVGDVTIPPGGIKRVPYWVFSTFFQYLELVK